eukprot:1157535-Prorocentrum_minimum.AAC.1
MAASGAPAGAPTDGVVVGLLGDRTNRSAADTSSVQAASQRCDWTRSGDGGDPRTVDSVDRWRPLGRRPLRPVRWTSPALPLASQDATRRPMAPPVPPVTSAAVPAAVTAGGAGILAGRCPVSPRGARLDTIVVPPARATVAARRRLTCAARSRPARRSNRPRRADASNGSRPVRLSDPAVPVTPRWECSWQRLPRIALRPSDRPYPLDPKAPGVVLYDKACTCAA